MFNKIYGRTVLNLNRSMSLIYETSKRIFHCIYNLKIINFIVYNLAYLTSRLRNIPPFSKSEFNIIFQTPATESYLLSVERSPNLHTTFLKNKVYGWASTYIVVYATICIPIVFSYHLMEEINVLVLKTLILNGEWLLSFPNPCPFSSLTLSFLSFYLLPPKHAIT
jgi:hypothetical protein